MGQGAADLPRLIVLAGREHACPSQDEARSVPLTTGHAHLEPGGAVMPVQVRTSSHGASPEVEMPARALGRWSGWLGAPRRAPACATRMYHQMAGSLSLSKKLRQHPPLGVTWRRRRDSNP